MLIDEYIIPEILTGDLLDEYLSKGYYRMRQSIFTTDYVVEVRTDYPVFWLRVNLNLLNQNILTKKLKNTASKFIVTIHDAGISDEIEELYAAYKAKIDFDTYETVSECLIGENNKNIFNSRMIQLHDKEKLIAVGYFDCGNQSLMGILNFYNHDYKRHSLGKYLMLLKLNYALQQGMKYYYPGYFSTSNSKYDYKIFPDKNAMEVYIRANNEWVNYTSVTKDKLEEDFWQELDASGG